MNGRTPGWDHTQYDEPTTAKDMMDVHGEPLGESCPACGSEVYQLPNKTRCVDGHTINP